MMSDRSAARLVIGGFALVLVAGVLLRPAMPVDETRYLAVAWEMRLGGDWLVPSKNFALYTDKPPLLFWAINAVWAFTGVSGIAARLVGPVAALATVLLTGRLAQRLWPEDAGAGARAAVALCGTFAFAFFGGTTMFDALLAATTVAAMLALLRAIETGRRRDWALLGAAVAAGVLAKGPVILVHVAPAIAAVPFWAPGRVSTRGLAAGAGLALATALGLVALWLVPAIVSGGAEYRDAVLWTQSAGRMTQSFAHVQPGWFYLAMLPVLLFPWILIPALWRAAARADRRDRGLRLCLVWGGVAVLFFSLISGKQTHYLLPELAAAALVVARLSAGLRGGLALATVPLLGAVAASVAAAAGALPIGEAATLFDPPSILVAWPVVAAAICWVAIRLGGIAGGAVLSLGLLLSLNLVVGLTETRQIYDTAGIARRIAPGEANGLAFYGQSYHAEFNFAGRLTRPVATPATAADLAAWAKAHPRGTIVARTDRAAPDWAPRRIVLFRNAPYGIWHVADAPGSERPA